MGKFKDEVMRMYQKSVENEIIEEIEKLENLTDLEVKKFTKEGGYSDKLARKWIKSLKTAQLRKFFDTIKDIEKDLKQKDVSWDEVEEKFYLLEPQLVYAAGRKVMGKPILPDGFYRIMKVCMRKIVRGDANIKKKNYMRFVQFLESIVAYHKYHEEKAKQKGGR